MKLYLALEPGFSIGQSWPFGVYSSSVGAQEALQRMTNEPIDWRPDPRPTAPADSWIGETASKPLRTVAGAPYAVRPFPLDGEGGLSAFVLALDSDDARDLRTLVSERLGGEEADAAYAMAQADRCVIGPEEPLGYDDRDRERDRPGRARARHMRGAWRDDRRRARRVYRLRRRALLYGDARLWVRRTRRVRRPPGGEVAMSGPVVEFPAGRRPKGSVSAVVSLDGRYRGELVRLEVVPNRGGRKLAAPYPAHGPGEHVVVTDAASGILVAYCYTAAEVRRYFPPGSTRRADREGEQPCQDKSRSTSPPGRILSLSRRTA